MPQFLRHNTYLLIVILHTYEHCKAYKTFKNVSEQSVGAG